MNKVFAMMVALVATLFTVNAFAWDPPPSPAPKSWIADPGHVLSDAAHARLDAKLRVINQSSANEVAALILPSLNGEAINDVADSTIKTWGVGKKDIDNGVLVVLAMAEHKSRISTGKGVEGDLPDLKCADILSGMRPYLRGNDVEGALGFAFDKSSSMIADHRAEMEAAKAAAARRAASGGAASSGQNNHSCQVSAPGSDGGSAWPWGLALLGLGLGAWFLAHRSAARRREQDELERAAQARLTRQRRLNEEREANRRTEEARLNTSTIPVVRAPVTPAVQRPVATPAPSFAVAPVVAAVAATAIINEAAEAEARREREAADRRRRDEEEASARRRRQQQEDDDRRRRESESSSSSSTSYSSYDSGSSSSGGGWDSGGSGGFGGGDSGGGGASGDW